MKQLLVFCSRWFLETLWCFFEFYPSSKHVWNIMFMVKPNKCNFLIITVGKPGYDKQINTSTHCQNSTEIPKTNLERHEGFHVHCVYTLFGQSTANCLGATPQGRNHHHYDILWPSLAWFSAKTRISCFHVAPRDITKSRLPTSLRCKPVHQYPYDPCMLYIWWHLPLIYPKC